jgi:hypothetical protein
MNPYYGAGFISALTFWIWPAFLFKHFDAHWLTVAVGAVVVISVLLFLGAGKVATEFHLDHIAPKNPPRVHPHRNPLRGGFCPWPGHAHDLLLRNRRRLICKPC